jgi:folate-binding protein YgfZ
VVRATHTAEDGFDLMVPSPTASDLWEALKLAGAEPVGLDVLDVLRIEAGLPLYGVDVDATNIVLEAGLDDTVSFTKGCYVGQEIIARIHWRGHVAKKISGLMFDEAPNMQIGDVVRSIEDKEIGRVTSTCFSPRLQKTIALGMIKYDYLTPGTHVSINSVDGEYYGLIAELPFVRGSWFDMGAKEREKDT